MCEQSIKSTLVEPQGHATYCFVSRTWPASVPTRRCLFMDYILKIMYLRTRLLFSGDLFCQDYFLFSIGLFDSLLLIKRQIEYQAHLTLDLAITLVVFSAQDIVDIQQTYTFLFCITKKKRNKTGNLIKWPVIGTVSVYEPQQDKINKMACAPSEDSDQPGGISHHCTLLEAKNPKTFFRRTTKTLIIIDWTNAQADLSLRLGKSLFLLSSGSYMDRVKRIWYLSLMRTAKVQASLRIRAVSPEPPLLAHTSSESRGTFRQKARSLAPLNGWACAIKICNDGMLEDTISLDGAHMINFVHKPIRRQTNVKLNRYHTTLLSWFNILTYNNVNLQNRKQV